MRLRHDSPPTTMMKNSGDVKQSHILSDTVRENTEKIVSPIVTWFAAIGLTPNMLTIMGVIVHIPVAWLLAQGRWQLGAVVGLLSLFDAFDGALARYLNSKRHNPKLGAFLDSVCDRVAEIILFAGILWYFTQLPHATGIVLTYIAAAGSLTVSYLRAKAETLGFSCRIGLFGRFERYVTLFIFGVLQQPLFCMIVLAFGTWFTVAQRLRFVYRQTQQSTSQNKKRQANA